MARIVKTENIEQTNRQDFGDGVAMAKDARTGAAYLIAEHVAVEIPATGAIVNGKINRALMVGLIDELKAALITTPRE